jgi:branched-chain amino acid transport system ATP-binding protein
VDGVDLTITEGEVRALIGPNGAGKTTLVGLVSGRLEPTSGRIIFAGEDITRLKAHERVIRGIVYTFQITSIFRHLTCFDNVALAAQRHLTRGRPLWAQAPEPELRRGATQSLAKVGLAAHSDQVAGSLAYGHQRLLELAMGLALRPRLLVLDEPTQGLPEEEVTAFCSLITALREESTVLLIEHNMSVVMKLADRITVMSSGRILAEGTPAEVRGNGAVRQAYLGT